MNESFTSRFESIRSQDWVKILVWVKLVVAFITLCLVVGLVVYIYTVIGRKVATTGETAERMETLLNKINEVQATSQANRAKVEKVEKKTDKAAIAAEKTATKTRRIEQVLKPILDNPKLVPALVPALVATPEAPLAVPSPTRRPQTRQGVIQNLFDPR